ncbi:hypothetical protein ANO11243_074340 [Dothideomycetidae sp. 11243]|nr:hypothetical protein ANO11243_074340 [fungal sp. No.11243]
MNDRQEPAQRPQNKKTGSRGSDGAGTNPELPDLDPAVEVWLLSFASPKHEPERRLEASKAFAICQTPLCFSEAKRTNEPCQKTRRFAQKFRPLFPRHDPTPRGRATYEAAGDRAQRVSW